jgi:hypothetical protein
MSITYTMGFSPKWYEALFNGLPAAGGYLASFSSLNHSSFKAIYEDDAGLEPYPYLAIPNQLGKTGIQFDSNGTQGPFFFSFDSTDTSDLYYLEFYDSVGNLQWTVDNYIPSGTGGSVVTTNVNLQNLVVNGQMYRNSGVTAVSPGTFMVLCPGANAGLALTSQNYGPDICFIKNDSSATDTVSFPLFSFGGTALSSDVTPVSYFNYTCTVAGTESSKYLQFPITGGVENLAGKQVTVTVWARINSGSSATLQLQFAQYFGEGTGASSVQLTSIGTHTMTSSWQQFSDTVTISGLTGNTIGSPATGNDGLFLQINLPLDETCSIDIIKPAVYLGSVAPVNDFATNDMIDAFMDNARTGDIKEFIGSNVPNGWVPLNNGTIGNYTPGVSSSNAVTRANVDTFPLFNLLWNYIPADIPMYTNAGVLQSRGASAVADFVANYQIQLPKSLGSVFAGSTPTLPANQVYTADHTTGHLNFAAPPYASTYGTGSPVVLINSGGAVPAGLSLGVIYYSIYVSSSAMQLALSPNLAKLGTAISFTDNGSGTNSITFRDDTIGEFEGERAHIQQPNETALNQVFSNGQFVFENVTGSSGAATLITPTATGGTSGTNPYQIGNASPVGMNVVQPTTYIGRIIKL